MKDNLNRITFYPDYHDFSQYIQRIPGYYRQIDQDQFHFVQRVRWNLYLIFTRNHRLIVYVNVSLKTTWFDGWNNWRNRLSWFCSRTVIKLRRHIMLSGWSLIQYVDTVNFTDILSILEQYLNFLLSISSLFPCIDCMLLKSRHVSSHKTIFTGLYHIKGKLYSSH
jgi:hypothetical protein